MLLPRVFEDLVVAGETTLSNRNFAEGQDSREEYFVGMFVSKQ